jgi:hypothetical protein
MSETNNIRNDSQQAGTHEGCLINFDKLEVGGYLFSVLHGRCKITNLTDRHHFQYPISLETDCMKFFSVTSEGREHSGQKIPSVFTENPYEYAVKQIKKYRDININLTTQNQELWQEAIKLRGEIHHLQAKIKKIEMDV